MNNTLNTVGQWVAKLGGSKGDYFYGIAVDSSNNYIAVGNEDYRSTNYEALIAKFDTTGNLLWQKKLGGSNYDYLRGITTDSSNNYIAVGYERSSSSVDYEALIAKFDTDGTLLWQKLLGSSISDVFNGIATDSSNNYIAVGYEYSSTSGNYSKALIAKFDTNGGLLWHKKICGSKDANFRGIAADPSNNYIAVGYENSSSNGNSYGALIAKFDTTGNLLWQKKLGGGSGDYFYGIAADSSNNYIAVGNENSSTSGDNSEALIAKFDTDGNLLWQKKLGGSKTDYFYGITADSSNNYIAVGYENSSTSGDNSEALIAKFDTDGNLLWQKKLGGSENDYFNGITADSSNNYIAVGYEHSSGNNAEALIAKFDTNGTIVAGALSSIPKLSLNDPALTVSTLSLTVADPALTLSLTVADPALTLSTPSLTYTKSTY